MLMSNFRTNILETIQEVWGCLVFHFLRFLRVAYHPFCLRSLHALLLIFSGPSYLESRGCRGCLSRIPSRRVMHLKVLVSSSPLEQKAETLRCAISHSLALVQSGTGPSN